MAALLAVVTFAAPASAAAPTLSVSLNGGSILAGETGSFDVSVSNGGSVDGYNLAVYLDVPEGIDFVSSSFGTPVIYDATNQPSTPLAAGMQRWVWEDVSDLPAGGDYSGSVTVEPAQPAPGSGETDVATVEPVGASFTIDAYASLSGEPTYLPVFNGSTGVGNAPAIAETGTDGPASRTVDIVSLLLSKSEPSPESELLRGVHDQSTVYTLKVTSTTQGATENTVLVDYIPAGLEFLGCGAVDNSTVDRDTADAAVNEYDGAATLAGTPSISSNCPVPTTVDTITADATLASQYGLTNGAVYTKVEWDLGTLAPGAVVTVKYAAGVPLRENTTTWDGVTAPDTVGEQTANLDNNNGPSTRHGSEATAEDGDSWTNTAAVAGDYQGVVRMGTDRAVGDTASETIDAMDLSVLKSVAPEDKDFDVDNIADFTLTLRASEYMTSSNIVLTDEIPNGLCPLLPAGVSFTNPDGLDLTDCETTGTVTGADVISATAHADGTFTLVLEPTPAPFALAPNTTHEITYEALNRGAYVTADAYGATTSGDSFGNTVEVEGDTTAITPIAADYPETFKVWDDSGESLYTDMTTIDKLVLPRDEVEAGLAPGEDPCTNGTFSNSLEGGFRLGDTVCFELRVNFPSSVDTRNPVVADFLPKGLTYVDYAVTGDSTVPGTDVSVDTSATAAGRIEWKLGALGEGGDLYVGRGALFEVHVWATVDEPSNGEELDKPSNLMKYRQENVDGDMYFLRDEANIEVEPEMQLVKGVESVTDNASTSSSTRSANSQDDADGDTFASNRDGIEVREGETVTYRIDLSNLRYAATASEVWDLLPDGIKRANVSGLPPNATVYDPEDTGEPGYPSGLSSANSDRSVIVWTNVPVDTFDSPSSTYRATLTYDVTIPVGTGISASLDNTASIIRYSAGINTSSDPAEQEYIPAGSLDTSLAATANTDGTGTTDDSDVFLPTASIAKSRTSPVTDNNTAAQVVPGEVAVFTYSVTVPAHTSVGNGVLQDYIPSFAGNWAILSDQTTVTYPDGAGGELTTSTGATGFMVGADAFTVNPNTGTVTFPTDYVNATDDDQTFEVTLHAYITAGSDWTHSPGTSRTDTARFTSDSADTLNRSANVRLIEPSPGIEKKANDTQLVAGQTITYTITASNAENRPTLYDATVTDCVPAELENVTLNPSGPSEGSAVTATGEAGCTGTKITWSGLELAGNESQTLTYTAEVSTDAAGGASYDNTADITGYSQPSSAPDRESYEDDSTENVKVVGSAITKEVDAPTATIGEERDYTVTVTIPAEVNFYDAAILDTVPAGMTISDATLSCEDEDSASCDGDLPGAVTPLTTSGTTYGWLLGDLASDAKVRTITLTYTGTVLDVSGNTATPSATSLVNTARMRWNSTNGTDPTSAGDTWTQSTAPDNATVTVVEPNIGVSKLVNGETSDVVNPGDSFTYTVKATNTGTSTGYDLTIKDEVPDHVIVTAGTISDGGVLTGADPTTGGGTITWTLSSLDVGAGNAKTFTYDATLAPSNNLTEAVLTNTATVTEYFSHPTSTTRFDDDERRKYDPTSDTADVNPGFPDPTVTKSAVGGPIAYIGENKSFTIRVYNGGDGPAENVVVTDDLPVGFAYVANSATVTGVGGTVNPTVTGDPETTGQTLTWNVLPDIAATSAITIAYQAVPLSSHTWNAANTGADVAHTNSAKVVVDDTSDAPANAVSTFEDDDDASVTINDADLSVTKSHTGSIVAGANTTWSIVVSNAAGSDPAVGPIVITDTLPDDATYVGVSGSGWSLVGVSGSVVTLQHAGPLAAGASLTANLTASFPADTASGTDAENSACVDARTFDSDTSDNCDDDPGTVIVEADVQLDKTLTDTDTDYVAGEPISWELSVTNNGPSISHSPFLITDSLPTGLDWSSVTSSGSGWSCGAVDGAGDIDCTWTGSNLGVDASLPTLTLTADVLSSTTDTLTNSATVYPTTTEPSSPGTSNNTDSVTTGALGAVADLGIVKTVDSDELIAGGSGRYRVEVTNNGPSDALNVIVADQLPTGLTYAGGLTSAAGDTWTCTPSGSVTGQVDCVLTSNSGTLVDGDTTWFEFDVDVASNVTAEVINTATVSSDTEDNNPDNDTDTARQDPFVETNISIAKTHPTTTVYQVGDEVTFTLTVTNDGVADAADVTITDAIPAGTTYARVENATGWTVTGPTAGVLTLTLDDPLASGDPDPTASIDVVLTLGADAVPGFTNTADVTTSTDETSTDDNSDSDPVEVDTPDLVIEKTANNTLVQGGDTFTYTLKVDNVDDDATASDVTVTDVIPFDLKVLDDPADIGGANWDCALAGTDSDGFGGTLTCDLDTLAADTTAPYISFDVSVSPEVARDQITNTATVSSPSEHASKVDALNSDDDTVTIKWIDVTASSVCVNDARWFDYTIDPRNVDNGLPITFTWYPDGDGDSVADGPAIATYTLDAVTNGNPITDSMLWPGSAVDASNVGIAWPGYRVVTAGETPDRENLILDPTLPEYDLLAGALVVIQTNPDASVHTDYPVTTPDCEVDRVATLDIDKTASVTKANRSQTFDYTLSVSNVAYGATNDVTVTDPIPSSLRVTDVVPAASTDPEIADWNACTVTGQDADGYGGTVECTLDGWLGYGQTAPDIVITVGFDPDAGMGNLTNVATVAWTDPDVVDPPVQTSDDPATISVVYSAAELLAFTGLTTVSGMWWALALVLFGLGAVIIGRRRRLEE